MESVILTLVVIGALFAIASGIWVATALVSAISGHSAIPGTRCQEDDEVL